ncbi:hypothetical protein M758_4G160600 [Ceratodon purpureus]|nr:hypothetical protein M758_4G160600 [Ceratodon purpureus]
MSLYKTKLCRHWERSGFCKMGESCGFAHGDHELGTINYGNQLMTTYGNIGFLPHGNIGFPPHDNIGFPPHGMYTNNIQYFPMDSMKEPEKARDGKYKKDESISNQIQINPKDHKRILKPFEEKSKKELEDGEFEEPKPSQKHHEEDISNTIPLPKRRKLNDDKVNESEEVSLKSPSSTCNELKNDKNDEVIDGCEKSSIAIVESFGSINEENQGDSHLKNNLLISPGDQGSNTNNDEGPLTSLELNIKSHDPKVETELKDCDHCQDLIACLKKSTVDIAALKEESAALKDRLKKTQEESAALKNLLEDVCRGYNEMKVAKLSLKGSIKAVEPFRIRNRRDIARS